MSKVGEALRVRRFDHQLSPEDFSSLIEASNVPAIFGGAIKDWSAISQWNPFDGGLDYLQEQVGPSAVEVMISKSAPVFYGDLRSHERVPIPFSMFISSCKLYHSTMGAATGSSAANRNFLNSDASTPFDETCSTTLDSLDHVYLAQVPILNMESKERCPLDSLQKDIQTPILLKKKQMSSVNLWMNKAWSRSSIHYDPHHNLLCVIAGCKQVVLWPPSACPLLYPMPVYGEASNHSAINIENPNLSVHTRARISVEHSQKAILYPGDALFIPEGWFHQVDSDDLTIAVNFWWKSDVMSSMLEHMDAYYLRRIVNRLLEKEKDEMLNKTFAANVGCRQNDEVCNNSQEGKHEYNSHVQNDSLKEKDEQHGGVVLNQLGPAALLALHELISLVHNTVTLSGQNQVGSHSVEVPNTSVGDGLKQNRTDDPLFLKTDPIASIFWNVEPLMLRKILLSMVQYFPRALEALILHMLSPTGAEVLTRKFDEMDQHTTKEQQSEFYRGFYGVFEDQHAAMDAILNGKEMFAFQALKDVLVLYLGVNYANSN